MEPNREIPNTWHDCNYCEVRTSATIRYLGRNIPADVETDVLMRLAIQDQKTVIRRFQQGEPLTKKCANCPTMIPAHWQTAVCEPCAMKIAGSEQ